MSDRYWRDVEAGCLFLAALLIALLTVFAGGAPAPLDRRPARLPTPCEVRTEAYAATLYGDGSYVAHNLDGAVWRGSWRLEGRLLCVRERYEGRDRRYGPGATLRWCVELRGDLSGGRAGCVALRPVASALENPP